MKHRVPESPEQPHLRAEPQSQQQRPRPLQDQRHRQNEAGPANDAPTWGAEMDSCITHRSFSPIRRPASMEMAAARGHHTHAANLNQHEDHRLAEAGPVQRRVLDHQSCHAGGGGGGEQRVEKGGAAVRVEMGRVSSSAPAKISSAKPIRMIRAGAMWFFLRMNTAIPLSVLSEAARGQQDHDNTDGPPRVCKKAAPAVWFPLKFSQKGTLQHAHCSTAPPARPPLFSRLPLHFLQSVI